jgi:hypothetical protein
LVELTFDGIFNAWVIVAKQVDPPGADAIQIALAVCIVKPHPFTPLNGDEWKRLVLLHLRAWMPYGMQAAG